MQAAWLAQGACELLAFDRSQAICAGLVERLRTSWVILLAQQAAQHGAGVGFVGSSDAVFCVG